MSESPAPIEIQQVKNDLLDPRTISKNNDQESRDKLASQLREKRRERDVLHQDIATTQTELDNRQSNLLVRLKAKLNIPDKQVQELEATKLEQGAKDENLPDTRKIVESYYEKVAETPLTNQEKRDLLKPEVLAELSADEYIALWKRLNSQFVTHVTRQGLRDHTGGDIMVNHTSGQGSFHNGLKDVMEGGKKIYTPMAKLGIDNLDEVTIKKYLDIYSLKADTKQEALERFHSTLHRKFAEAPNYPDITSTHFGVQQVLDKYYGGETNNEIFFVYPTDIVASQNPFAFNAREQSFTDIPLNEDAKWNDLFVWTDPNEPGIPVDSGFVFLPKNTQVDQNTGSRYNSEVISSEDGKDYLVPVIKKDIVDKFNEWADKSIEKYKNIAPENVYAELSKDMKDIGIPDESINNLFYTNFLYQSIYDLRYSNQYVNKDNEIKDIKNALNNSSAKFELASNTITAMNYWEKIFQQNPDMRPKHIYYYDGDPTNAIKKFQIENDIRSQNIAEANTPLLGFDYNHVTDMENDPRANPKLIELTKLGEKIIEEHYSTSLETA